MSSFGPVKALCLCVLLVGLCAAQKANPVAAGSDIRPAIFQRGQAVQPVAVSPSASNAQLSTVNAHIATDEEVNGMEQTLEQYVVAFENLSLPQVKQVWPDLDTKHAKAFKDLFAALKGQPSPRLGLQCAIPKVSVETANVDCLETVTYSVGKGKTKEAGPAKVFIQLKGKSGHWLVQDMKGTG